MKVKLLNRKGEWRSKAALRNEVYRAWQRYDNLLDRKKAAFINEEVEEPTRYGERLIRYQDRVCDGMVECHEKARLAYQGWEETELFHKSLVLAEVKDDLLADIEDDSYRDQYPDRFIFDIERIANELPYVRRSKCKR